MAHIPDGILAAPMLIVGATVSLTALAVALRRLEYEQIPQTAVLSAALFVASLIAIPVGPASAHLLLNGLMGLVLGWAAVPAILVALLLQSLLFGFGGLLALGVNGLNMLLPALLCAALLRRQLYAQPQRAALWGGLAGGLAVLCTGGLVALSLTLGNPDYRVVAQLLLLAYLPLALVEALVTAAVVGFVFRVAPELLARAVPAGARPR